MYLLLLYSAAVLVFLTKIVTTIKKKTIKRKTLNKIIKLQKPSQFFIVKLVSDANIIEEMAKLDRNWSLFSKEKK